VIASGRHDASLTDLVRARRGWVLTDEDVATYTGSDRSAVVRRPAMPDRPSRRWAVSVLDSRGVPIYVTWASTAAEAVRVVERHVGSGPATEDQVAD